ncbi:LysR family transcriptional regulator [Streptomyces olivoreticuli]|uniref:LysR family transcriptional regulator n=1 Tax=Streptomyces olivoreticuli TaxID=68246 RepID=UPI0013C37A02|nr:LysR family transcriptional regulator [Streptomyces olivoreticuli]
MTSISALRTLRELRRLGSVHAVAQAMHLAPSSVSQRIKGLGEECGMPLFERSGRGGRLTDRGEAVAELAEKITHQWERGMVNIRSGASQAPRRSVSIGAFPSALTGCVLPAAERLRGQNHFQIELLEVDPRGAASQVEHAELDMVLTLGEVLDADQSLDPRLTVRELWREPFALVLPEAFASAGDSTASIRNYADVPWVLPRRGSACDLMVGRHLARLGVRPRVVARSDDWSLVQRMACATQGVALVPLTCVDEERGDVRVAPVRRTELLERTVVALESVESAGSRWLPLVRAELDRSAKELIEQIQDRLPAITG